MMSAIDPILVADLMGYVRLVDTVPSFVLPVFGADSEHGANIVVQHIEDGIVQYFIPFDPESSPVYRMVPGTALSDQVTSRYWATRLQTGLQLYREGECLSSIFRPSFARLTWPISRLVAEN